MCRLLQRLALKGLNVLCGVLSESSLSAKGFWSTDELIVHIAFIFYTFPESVSTIERLHIF